MHSHLGTLSHGVHEHNHPAFWQQLTSCAANQEQWGAGSAATTLQFQCPKIFGPLNYLTIHDRGGCGPFSPEAVKLQQLQHLTSCFEDLLVNVHVDAYSMPIATLMFNHAHLVLCKLLHSLLDVAVVMIHGGLGRGSATIWNHACAADHNVMKLLTSATCSSMAGDLHLLL